VFTGDARRRLALARVGTHQKEIPMASTFPPRREAELVSFTGQFKTKIAAQATSLGLVASQATQYGTYSDQFVADWNLYQDPATRTKPNLEAKSASKAQLIAYLRELVRIIQNHPGVTNEMRADLQLPLRGNGPIPAPVPSLIPKVEVSSVYGSNVTLKITDPTDDRRALPQGVQGIQLFTATGETAPPPGGGWTAQGVVTRRKIVVQFPADSTPPGTKVWFSALYFNRRGMTGLASTPTWSHIGYEGATPMTA
jgi:hypothetical protein